MPKSRRRRKGPSFKRRRGASGPEPLDRPGASATYTTSEMKSSGRGASDRSTLSPELNKDTLRTLLQDPDGVLGTIVSIAPLPIGAWVAGGIELAYPLVFALLLAQVILCHYARNIVRVGELLPFPQTIVQLIHIGLAVTLLLFYSATNDVIASLLALSMVVLTRLGDLVVRSTPRAVIVVALSIVVRMSLLAILGAYCQFPAIVLEVGMLGFIPGAIYAAASVASHADVLEASGWKRTFTHTNKKGEVTERPGGVTRAYVLVLLLGPIIPVATLPFSGLPAAFIISAAPLARAPMLFQQFAGRLAPDSVTARQTIKLAAWSAVLNLALGVAATHRLI